MVFICVRVPSGGRMNPSAEIPDDSLRDRQRRDIVKNIALPEPG
jgi:hypothetical protein